MDKRGKSAGNKAFCRIFTAVICLLFLFGDGQKATAADAKQPAWRQGAGVADMLDGRIAENEHTKSAGITTAAGNGSTEDEKDRNSPDTEAGHGAAAEAEKAELVMADVDNVLNVRTEPDAEAGLAGYLYADCGGRLLERRGGWTKLSSGELTGWASDEYLLFGEEAKEAAQDAGRTVARTTTGALRIRKAPAMDAGVYDLLEEGAEYEVIDEKQLAFSDGITISEDWVAVDYGGLTGFVSSEYVEVEFMVDQGETVEQVKEREAEEERLAEELRKEQEKALAQEKKEKQEKEIQKARALAADDVTLLAALIQCESGDEPYEGQLAVGAVVMNRVRSGAYPNTIKGVIFASGQFSPAGSGQLGRRIASGQIKSSCIQAATEAMAGASPVGGATHFRRAGSREGIVIGNHVFW